MTHPGTPIAPDFASSMPYEQRLWNLCATSPKSVRVNAAAIGREADGEIERLAALSAAPQSLNVAAQPNDAKSTEE